MTHSEQFHDLPVFTIPATDPGIPQSLARRRNAAAHEPPAPPAAAAVAWRLDCGWSDWPTFADLWRHFLDSVDTEQVRALVLGPWWHDDYTSIKPVLELMLSDADRFPALRALHLADVGSEQCEVSWLLMTDITPVLEGFPLLEEFKVLGCGSYSDGPLEMRPVIHESLRVLSIMSGGLPGAVVRAVGDSTLPALERLELWLGVDEYGGDSTIADLAPFLTGVHFPRLRHLGLQNSEIQDEIAATVASAPVVAGLESLALGMGTLTDEGAEALLTGQPLTHLKKLGLEHHFVSEPWQRRIRDALEPSGVTVDLSDPQDEDPDDGWRYVALSE